MSSKSQEVFEALKKLDSRYSVTKCLSDGQLLSKRDVDSRWQSGATEIANSLNAIYKALAEMEKSLTIAAGANAKKSASLKVLEGIRKALCDGKISGKKLPEIYKIAKEASRALKGVGRKSFILHPTASLNSSESIGLLNMWGRKLFAMVSAWEKSANLTTKKMTAGVKDSLRKILNKPTIEKTIKHLNEIQAKKNEYIAYWDLIRDTDDSQIVVTTFSDSSFDIEGGSNLNGRWNLTETTLTGEDAKTKILKELNQLKELLAEDGGSVRYSKDFKDLVDAVIECVKGEEVTGSGKITAKMGKETTKILGKHVNDASRVVRELQDRVAKVDKVVPKIKEAKKELKAKENALEKAVGGVNKKKPETLVPVMKALKELSIANGKVESAFSKFQKGDTATTIYDDLEELRKEFVEKVQFVPTEVRAKELAGDLFTVTKIPRAKRKNETIYTLKETPKLLKTIKTGKEGAKLVSSENKDREATKKVETNSMIKVSKHLGILVGDLCSKVDAGDSDGLTKLGNELGDLSISAGDISLKADMKTLDDKISNYKNTETAYNNFYISKGIKDLEKEFESLQEILGIISTMEGDSKNKSFDDVKTKAKGWLASIQSNKKALDDTLKAVWNTKLKVFEEAKKALEQARNDKSEAEKLLAEAQEVIQEDQTIKDTKGKLKNTEKAILEAERAIVEIESEISKGNGAVAISAALEKIANAKSLAAEAKSLAVQAAEKARAIQEAKIEAARINAQEFIDKAQRAINDALQKGVDTIQLQRDLNNVQKDLNTAVTKEDIQGIAKAGDAADKIGNSTHRELALNEPTKQNSENVRKKAKNALATARKSIESASKSGVDVQEANKSYEEAAQIFHSGIQRGESIDQIEKAAGLIKEKTKAIQQAVAKSVVQKKFGDIWRIHDDKVSKYDIWQEAKVETVYGEAKSDYDKAISANTIDDVNKFADSVKVKIERLIQEASEIFGDKKTEVEKIIKRFQSADEAIFADVEKTINEANNVWKLANKAAGKVNEISEAFEKAWESAELATKAAKEAATKAAKEAEEAEKKN